MESVIKTLRKALAAAALTAATLVPAAAMAQTGTLKGTVTDEADEPIAGAVISDSNNKYTAMTDADGNFTISSVPFNTEVKCNFLGYKPISLKWDGKTPLQFKMEPDVVMLDETVVIGYAVVKKKDLTGAVGAIDSERLSKQRSPNLSTALQGAIPGLEITRNGSMPGASGSIQVRGVTTMGDSSPLILVDGTPVSSIDNVNPDDVDQISVLKDAAAASIYGARAAAGVILITTKGAKEGDLKITYNGEVSLIHASSYPDFVTDPIRHMQVINELRWNEAGNPEGGEYPTYSKDYIDSYLTNNYFDPIEYPIYDWRDRLLRKNAPRHKHTLSLSYGNKQVKTRISASYEKTEALYRNSNHERIFMRANNALNFNKQWSANVDLSMRHAVKNDPHSGSPIGAALRYPAIYLGTYPDGRIASGQSGSNTEGAFTQGGEKKNTVDYLTGRISLTYKPFDFLTFNANITPTMQWQKVKDMQKAVPFYDAYETDQLLGYVSGYETNNLTETRLDTRSLEKSITATFYKDFGLHNVNVMAGYEDYSYHYETMTTTTEDMTLGDYPYLDNANKNKITTSGSAFENAYRSFFGRVMYNFNSRYFLQANIRSDGSSRFDSKYRWGWFPSASLGWRLTNESFMAGVSPVLSNMMIRASYGSLGNERIGNYPYQASVNLLNNVMFGSQGPESATAGAQVRYAVRDITWESTHTWDVGVDFSMFNNRLDFTGDIYYKKTKDMLIATEIPLFTGYEPPEVNAGDMNTRGWEIKLSWRDNINRDWSYSVGFNLSDSKSKMGNLGGTVKYSGDCIIREGDEYMAFYGYRSMGLYQTADEVANSAKLIAAVGPGDVRYQDLGGADGVPDGAIDATYDREVLGASLPHLLYGGYINVGWKDIHLSATFNGVGRKKVRMSEVMVRQQSFRAAPEIIMGNYWSLYNTPEQNLDARYPRLCNTTGDKNNYEMSDFWLMDGSYFRCKNINLSYTFPKKLINRIRLKNLRVYVNVEDPFCFHHYPKGWDPEVNASATNYIATTYTFGVDLSF